MFMHPHKHTPNITRSSLTELTLGTYIWSARISQEPCGDNVWTHTWVCGQWQLSWSAITRLSAWLNTTAGASVYSRRGIGLFSPTTVVHNPQLLCSQRPNFFGHLFLHSSRLFQDISSAPYLRLLHTTMLLQFIPISLLIWSQPWKRELICKRSLLPCH